MGSGPLSSLRDETKCDAGTPPLLIYLALSGTNSTPTKWRLTDWAWPGHRDFAAVSFIDGDDNASLGGATDVLTAEDQVAVEADGGASESAAL